MHRFLLVSLTLCGSACVACGASAEMASPAGSRLDLPAPPDWRGFFVGGHGSFVSAGTDYPGNPATPEQSFEGAMGGVQAGYNWQVDRIIFGVEADVAFGDLDDFVQDGNFLTEDGALSWLATARARVGYTFGDILLYGTGGIAWTRLEQGTACPAGAAFGICSITGPFDISLEETITGWVVGGGAEYSFAEGWSVKGEVLVFGFREEEYTSDASIGAGLGGAPAGGGTKITVPVDLDVDVVGKLGINYRF